jgi:hypothetical protein
MEAITDVSKTTRATINHETTYILNSIDRYRPGLIMVVTVGVKTLSKRRVFTIQIWLLNKRRSYAKEFQ